MGRPKKGAREIVNISAALLDMIYLMNFRMLAKICLPS